MSNLLTIMDSIFDDMRPSIYRSAGSLALPALNIKEYSNRYEITVTIAGIDPSKVKIELVDKLLNISYEDTSTKKVEDSAGDSTGDSTKETDETKEKQEVGVLLREEYRHYSFNRSVSLPKNVDQSSVKAKSKQGILTITVDKSPEVQPQKIEIEHE